MFQTPYNRSNFIVGENYTKVVSCTQPEQVLPLKRILDGLKNGTILLNSPAQQFDIPEHEIDFVQGKTPEQTNANIHAASLNDLNEQAAAAGDDITAAPGFTIEDAHPLVDAVEGVIEAQAASEGGTVGAGEGGSSSQSKSDADGASGDGTLPSGDASNGN